MVVSTLHNNLSLLKQFWYIFLHLLTVIKHYQDYVEPDSASSSRLTAPSAGEESDANIIPLGENVLINNLGVPIILVLTKV